jgi:hypothetical protein
MFCADIIRFAVSRLLDGDEVCEEGDDLVDVVFSDDDRGDETGATVEGGKPELVMLVLVQASLRNSGFRRVTGGGVKLRGAEGLGL